MRLLKVKPHLTDAQLKAAMNRQKTIHDFRDWQIIYSVQINPGKKATELADILGIKTENIYKKVQKYNKLGVSWKEDVIRGGRREERCIMTLDKEKEFLKNIEKDALNGHIITYQQIKLKLEEQINRSVSNDYIWDMFKRHNWKKKVPHNLIGKRINPHRKSIKKTLGKSGIQIIRVQKPRRYTTDKVVFSG